MFSLFLLGLASAHVTFEPNYGAMSGWYHTASFKVPHAIDGYYTTKLEIQVPQGVRSVKPQKHFGWDITVTERELVHPYTSHGSLVTTGPDKITITANDVEHALHDDHLMTVTFNVKFGCSFPESKLWLDDLMPTWWPTIQTLSSHGTLDPEMTLDWIGIPEGSQSWASAQPKPAPYITLYSSDKCVNSDSGEAGLTWGSTFYEPNDDTATIKDVQHVRSLIEEYFLDVHEELKSAAKTETIINNRDSTTDEIAWAAIGLCAFMILMFSCLVCIRVLKPQKFGAIVGYTSMDADTTVNVKY